VRQTPLPAADRIAQRWKNGGGVTEVVATDGADFDFDWRVSIAQVETDGPFSVFPGVDRMLTVLRGALSLSIDGRPGVTLTSEAGPYAFSGDAPCEARVVTPVVDLNIMTRRGAVDARMDHADGPTIMPRAPIALIVALTACRVGQHALSPLDVLRIDDGAGRALAFAGEAWVIEIDVRGAGRSGDVARTREKS
jgi:environmental stress-induced protein Ves